jgi:predicted Zn-dependent protease
VQPAVKTFFTGALLVLLFDTVGATASRLIGFPYATLTIGSFIIYLALTHRAARQAGVLTAIAVGAVLGLVDSTLGWAISWAIGPGRPTEPMSAAPIAGTILFVVGLGATWGLLGGIAARSMFGKAAVVALVGIAGLFEILNLSKARVIYFVPIGEFASVPLAELESYCADRFAVRVVTLPLLPVDKSTYDPLRDQLIAQELVLQMKRRYSKEAQDPSAVLIAVTDGDMYVRSKDWQFAFGYREDGRFGVVSAARMNPVRFGDPRDDRLLHTRVRKMVVRTVAFLYQGLAPSDRPNSVLYGKLLGLEELDAMGEEF